MSSYALWVAPSRLDTWCFPAEGGVGPAGIPPRRRIRAQGNGGPGMFGPRRRCRATDRSSLGGRGPGVKADPFGALRGLDPLRLGNRSWQAPALHSRRPSCIPP